MKIHPGEFMLILQSQPCNIDVSIDTGPERETDINVKRQDNDVCYMGSRTVASIVEDVKP